MERALHKMYFRDVDPYTKIIKYYDCTVDTDIMVFDSRILDDKPEGEIYDYYDYVDSSGFKSEITKSINGAIDAYNDRMTYDDRYFRMADLYDYKNKIDSYEKYINLKDILLDKCNELDISIPDSEIINNNIIKEIDNEVRRYTRSKGFESGADLSFTINKESIDERFNEEINSEMNSRKFTYARRHLINYYSSFIDGLPTLLRILDKSELNNNDKLVIKNYACLFSILPDYMDKLDYLEVKGNEIDDYRINNKKNDLYNNIDFISKMDNMLDLVDIDSNDIFIHATTSLDSANSIIDNGLYTYSDDIESFAFPYSDIEQVLTYEYGGVVDSSKVGDFVVLFSVPKDELDIIPLSEDEQLEASGNIKMRRNGVFTTPKYKIDSNNILGFIDKKNANVVINPNYNKSNEDLKTY